jgi:hypothetical protein
MLFGLRRNGVMEVGWSYTVRSFKLCARSNVMRMSKSKRMSCMQHVVRVGEIGGAGSMSNGNVKLTYHVKFLSL